MMRVVTLLLVAALAPGLAASEERDRPHREHRPRGEAREVVETVRMARLADALELDDEEIVKLVRRYNNMRETQRELESAHETAVDELRELVRENGDPEVIEEKLEDVREKEAAVLRFQWTGFDEIVEDLTPTQQAKLYVFAQDFESDMRRLVKRARSIRWEAGPPEGESAWSDWPRMSPEEWEARVREWRDLDPGERETWMRRWREDRDEFERSRGRRDEDSGGSQ